VKTGSRRIIDVALLCGFGLFLLTSLVVGFEPGNRVGRTFVATLADMMKVLPCAFVLVGLFDAWVKPETIDRHFGETSGIRGYVGVLLLAGTTVGGIYVAFPVAYSLYKKGAKLGVIFAYIGLSGACRIPMIMFEAAFMGMTFTAVRLIVTVPLVYLSAIALSLFLARRGYKLLE
jgi:uncharacterized membrane protein YraQ (UPF0718 family)